MALSAEFLFLPLFHQRFFVAGIQLMVIRELSNDCMKEITFIVASIAMSFTSFCHNQIKGHWLTGDGNSIIEIYESANGKQGGKIVWLEQPASKAGEPRTDKMNPDAKLRDRPIIGLDVLPNLSYYNGQWKGKLYTPKTGRTVDAVFSLENENKLKLTVSFRGFLREQYWTRTELPK
jgi:uncharacterized protein (DUF2147 family)